jgi:hypothetical protein
MLVEDHTCELECETAVEGDSSITCRDGLLTWPGVCGQKAAPPADATEVQHIWDMVCVAVSAASTQAIYRCK